MCYGRTFLSTFLEQLATWKTSALSISVPASESGECQQSCTCLIICCCTVVTTDQNAGTDRMQVTVSRRDQCKLLSDEGTSLCGEWFRSLHMSLPAMSQNFSYQCWRCLYTFGKSMKLTEVSIYIRLVVR